MSSGYRPQPFRAAASASATTRAADRYFELKSEIHRKLIGVLNLEQVSSLPKDRLRVEIGRVVERLLEEERVPMTTAEQNKIVGEVLDMLQAMNTGVEGSTSTVHANTPQRCLLAPRYHGHDGGPGDSGARDPATTRLRHFVFEETLSVNI